MTKPKPKKKTYGLATVNYIKSRISVPKDANEDQSNFIIRELVQNADDVKASSLVLRFQKDALYVANDGKPFDEEDYTAVVDILSGSKEYDKDSTGNFGSGFVTVFRLTNHPEIHSNGTSIVIDPVRETWFAYEEKRPIEFDELESPFDKRNKHRGVLFRFPWRRKKQAEDEYPDCDDDNPNLIQPFQSQNDWPRWNKQNIWEFYEELKTYIHDVFLCCQHLTRITIIWSYDEKEAYQVNRDFTLHKITQEIGTVEEGTCYYVDKFKKSFQQLNWHGYPTQYPYYVIHNYVRNYERGKKQLFIYQKNQEIYIDSDVPSDGKIIRRNDVSLLFPLYDIDERYNETDDKISDYTSYRYATIPLPSRTSNKFIFSGHFVPMEDRKGVDVKGYDGKADDWYISIMNTIANLYHECFDKFMEEVQKKDYDIQEQQKIILNSLPGGPIWKWMREDGYHEKWEKPVEKILEVIKKKKWIYFISDWYGLENKSYIVSDKIEYDALWAVGGIPLWEGLDNESGDITNHFNFDSYLKDILEEYVFDEDKFEVLFKEFVKRYENEYSKSFSDSALELIIKYCDNKKKNTNLLIH